MCHVSHVTFHVSYVMFFFFFFKVVKLFGGGSVINGATPSSLLSMASRIRILNGGHPLLEESVGLPVTVEPLLGHPEGRPLQEVWPKKIL